MGAADTIAEDAPKFVEPFKAYMKENIAAMLISD